MSERSRRTAAVTLRNVAETVNHERGTIASGSVIALVSGLSLSKNPEAAIGAALLVGLTPVFVAGLVGMARARRELRRERASR